MDHQVIPFLGIEKVMELVSGILQVINEKVLMKFFSFPVVDPLQQRD
jgi:hypothetical protein